MADEVHSTAIDRALSILELLAKQGEGLTNSQISRRLDIPKSSASYLLRTLERRGYLRREHTTGKYRLGLKVLALNRNVLAGLDILQVALPRLRSLVESSDLTTHLAMLDRGQAVYVAKVEASGFIKMDTWVGRRMDVHCTSVGKALTAYLERQDVEAILRDHGLRKRTPKTITVASKFMQELEKVRRQGYAVDDEENSVGVRCLAAPVFDSTGAVQAAVGVTGTVSQIDAAKLPKIANLVRDAARKISKELGY